MNLGEQLDELRVNVLRDRSDIISGESDSLWSDETLLKYIKDAERRFARQTMILRDSTTPEVIRITLKTGVTTYPAHPSVIAVISARFDADSFDLQRSGHGLILQFTPPEFLTYDPNAAYTIPPGRPIAYYTDETLVFARQGKVTVSVYPTPGPDENNKVLSLRVVRLPMGEYSTSDLNRESELPEDYQLEALEWAAYRAQRGYDADAGSSTQADKHKEAFDEAVLRAQREAKRKVFANLTVRYGMNGFSWTR